MPTSTMDLPLPLFEDVLASLPLRSLLAVAAASKGLRCLVASPSFASLHSRNVCASPWFFFFGFNRLLPHHSQAFAFDPLSFSWLRIPLSTPPPHNTSSLSASNGSLFALSGALQTRLCIAPSPLKQNWQVIEPSMRIGRQRPLVGIFYNDTCRLDIASIIVAGGIDETEKESDELAVEEYNAEKGEWERCEPMPEALKGKSLSSAIAGGKFYVGDSEGGAICWREREGGRWKEGKMEKPSGVKGWQWVGIEGGLIAVAVCAGGGLKVYRMEEGEGEGGVRMREVAAMPAELCQLFEEEGEEEEEKVVKVSSCSGGGNMVYVYSESAFKEYAACACEVGVDGRRSRWNRLPPMPANLHRFDRVSCLSASVPLPACFTLVKH